ncbi:MAG: HAD-IB family hydrolase [Candidatus Woesearchaeota archaeon]
MRTPSKNKLTTQEHIRTVTPDIAIFDVDGTLFAFNTEKKGMLFLYHQKLMPLSYLVDIMLRNLISKTFVRKKILKQGLWFLKGKSKKELEQLAKHYYATTLKHKIAPRMREEITKHAAKGNRIIILSASPQILLEELGREIKATAVLGSILEEQDGRMTGNIISWNYGEEKMRRLLRLLQEWNVNRATTKLWYYADSLDDLPVLTFVDYPIAVNPEKKLLAIAKKNQWQIITFPKVED